MAQGQIEKRGERAWRLRWFLGRDASGRRRYGSKTIHGTKRDAQSALRKVQQQLESGIVVGSKRLTLDAYLDRWLEDAAPKKRRANTVHDYREKLKRYVRPYVGAQRLDRLTPLDVQAMVAELERKRLSPQTIRYAHAVLSAALGQAVRWRMIASNPARDVELPKRRAREMRFLTAEECGRLRQALEGDRLEALFLLLLGTGMRPGEALALRWQSVDLSAGWVRIERSLGRKVKGDPWRFEEPKTAKGRRTLGLPPSVTQALGAHRTAQSEERLKAGSAYVDLGLAFGDPLGGPLHERNVVNRHFKPALTRAKLKEVRLYDLRHTAATLMLAGGAQVRAQYSIFDNVHTKLQNPFYSAMLRMVLVRLDYLG